MAKDEKAPEGEAPTTDKPKAPPREPAEYVVLTPEVIDGRTLYSEVTRVIALTGKKAKAVVAAQLSTSGQLQGDGVDLIATPARTFVAERARVEQRQPVVKVG